MKLKKDFKTSALAILLVITVIALLDSARTSDFSAALKKDNDELFEKVAALEKEIEERSIATDELKQENDLLTENVSNLEEEVNALHTSVTYQDFNAAISSVEEYKSAETFKEATDLIALVDGIGASSLDREGNCPCSFTFKGEWVEWIPNAVLNLTEFSLEKDRIVLGYQTVESIEHNYQFVMTKGAGWNDLMERWRIAEIRLEEKEM